MPTAIVKAMQRSMRPPGLVLLEASCVAGRAGDKASRCDRRSQCRVDVNPDAAFEDQRLKGIDTAGHPQRRRVVLVPLGAVGLATSTRCAKP